MLLSYKSRRNADREGYTRSLKIGPEPFHTVVVYFSKYTCTAILQSRRNADRDGFSTSHTMEAMVIIFVV